MAFFTYRLFINKEKIIGAHTGKKEKENSFMLILVTEFMVVSFLIDSKTGCMKLNLLLICILV